MSDMKSIILLSFIALVAAQTNTDFQNFMTKYNKKYATAADQNQAQSNFLANFNRVNASNQASRNFTSAIYSFSDKTTATLKSAMGKSVWNAVSYVTGQTAVLPTFVNTTLKSVNWTSLCQPVVDQGMNNPSCAASWAFAAVAQMETVYKKNDSTFNTPLSQQFFIDCVGIEKGCTSGWPHSALSYAYMKSIPTNATYPYTATKAASCPSTTFLPKKINATFQVQLNGNETTLKNMVAVQPVVVSVYVTDDFLNYKSGVFQDQFCPNECQETNHAMLLVGYGTDPVSNLDYWLLRNSWGSNWGENGYMRILRNSENTDTSKFNLFSCNVACWVQFAK